VAPPRPARVASGAELVHPIAVRRGLRLFGEGERTQPLTLLSSRALRTGVLELVYGPGELPGDAGYDDVKKFASDRGGE
jgi:hypothetical protein